MDPSYTLLKTIPLETISIVLMGCSFTIIPKGGLPKGGAQQALMFFKLLKDLKQTDTLGSSLKVQCILLDSISIQMNPFVSITKSNPPRNKCHYCGALFIQYYSEGWPSQRGSTAKIDFLQTIKGLSKETDRLGSSLDSSAFHWIPAEFNWTLHIHY